MGYRAGYFADYYGSGTYDVTVTVGSSDDLLVAVFGGEENCFALSSVTIDPGGADEAAFTLDKAQQSATLGIQAEVWSLLSANIPAAGSYTVRFILGSPSGSNKASYGVLCFTGMAQSHAEATAADTSESSNAGPGTTITTLTDGAFVVDVVATQQAASGYSADGSQTNVHDDLDQNNSGAGGISYLEVASAGGQSIGWTWTFANNPMSYAGAAFAPAGGGNALTPSTATLTLTAYAPAVTGYDLGVSVTPGTATLSLTGYGPTVTINSSPGSSTQIEPYTSTLTFTGYAPTVDYSPGAVTPSTATISFTGYAPTIGGTANQYLQPGTSSLTFTGYAPVVLGLTNHLQPSTATLSLTSYAPTVAGVTIKGLAVGTPPWPFRASRAPSPG